MNLPIRVALVAPALLLAPTFAFAGMEGEWRCKASGNIPIAVVTISGSSYTYQAVKNTAWELKANDRANGSGELNIDGDNFTASSGPLADIFGVAGSYCNEDTGCANEYLALDSTVHIPLGCWRW